MDYETLYNKYLELLEENRVLKEKIKAFRIGTNSKEEEKNDESLLLFPVEKQDVENTSKFKKEHSSQSLFNENRINNYSPKDDKIALYSSLFKGRTDVYAKRWENRKGQSGYSPACDNEWEPGICNKPNIKCSNCTQKSFSELNEKVLEKHLLGEMVVGIYAMNLDETCNFLAIDFDKKGWEKDIAAVRETCNVNAIPCAVERSRSGNGGHIWFFFTEAVSATLARKFGTSLLTYSMQNRYEIAFTSYDRLFPNQDTMPKGGFGNLIALPLQKTVRKTGNSVFVDENFQPYTDQWAFLSSIKPINENELVLFCKALTKDNELGVLKNYEIDGSKPWQTKTNQLEPEDYPEKIEVVQSSLFYIGKQGLNSRLLNSLKRLAAFKNPDFYKTQAMRLPTYNKPRVISCSEDFENYLALPRGCKDDVTKLIGKKRIKFIVTDERTLGKAIKVKFNGELRPAQQKAANELLKHDIGVLSATTAFGKTVVGAKLIAERKINTLIIVHRQQLLAQWKERLSQFLNIAEKLPEILQKKGSKKKLEVIGQLGAGKNQLNFIVDIAIMQSLNSKGEINECVKNYGMVIVDECHHVPAFSFEQILKNVTAQFIYGLTATPVRPDGHHPIIFFYCGPVRFLDDAKQEARKRPFEHVLIPRFTSFKIQNNEDRKEKTIQEVYTDLVDDELRNHGIIEDIVNNYKKGRNALVLAGRVKHVKLLADLLEKQIAEVITLTGGMGAKSTRNAMGKLSNISSGKPFVIVATGSFIGEGFDEPRLDTLFLATPIAWKGTLQQYVGRLHRLHENKKEVQVYDYVDVHVPVLEKMYQKRMKGYVSAGYKAKAEIGTVSPTNIIFDKQSFFPVYSNDIENAKNRILIVSPYITQKRIKSILPLFTDLIKRKVKVEIITRPTEDFPESKKASLEYSFTMLREARIKLTLRSKFHQKFAIIDQKICWYGSINLLSFGWSEESIMRITSGNIAYELEKSMG